MAKAKLVTRNTAVSTVTQDSLAQGVPLSYEQLDSNLINLRDQSFAITDGVNTVSVESGDTVTFSGATVSGNTVTIAGGNETVTALTSASSITVDCSQGNVFTVTLGHNATFSFSNFDTGQSIAIKVKQDGTGGRTATFSGVKFAFGDSVISSGANTISFLTIFNDGTDKLGAVNRSYS